MVAVLIDWMALLLMLAVAMVVAFAWLLLRTQAGRYDAPAPDALAAASSVAAAVPAWAAWQAARLYTRGATVGQWRLGLTVHGSPRRRVVRFVLHPAFFPVWMWLAVTAVVAEGLRPALAVLSWATAATILTGIPLLVPRYRRPLHDLATGTRLARRP